MNTKKIVGMALITAVAVLISGTAEAHIIDAHGAGFGEGFAHPFSGLDHLLAMVTVGLWAAQRGGKAIWVIPLTFMVAMAGGGALGLLGVQLPMVELGIAVSLMVLGAVVALSFRPPLWVGMVIVALFAVFHGHAHGVEIPEAASPVFYATGFLVATGVLHAIGVSLCTALQRQGVFGAVSDYAVRSAGVVVAACGVAFALL